MDADEKFRLDVEYKIERHADRLGLKPTVPHLGKSLYNQYHSSEQAYTREDDVFALAALYLAHKVQREPASVSTLVADTEFEEKYVYRASRVMQRTLATEHDFDFRGVEPTAFVEQYVSALDASAEAEEIAKEIIRETPSTLQNCANSTKAAAALYLATHYTGEKLTREDIAEVSGVSGVTIGNRYQEQRDALADGWSPP